MILEHVRQRSKDIFTSYMDSPIGTISLSGTASTLTGLSFDPTSYKTANNFSLAQRSSSLSDAINQLNNYFEGTLRDFDLDIGLDGTDFQIQVWNAIRKIPYGETATYGEVASWIGHPKSARAVGNALRVNPILIVIPCHRVIGAGGAISGFKAGVQTKSELLRLESSPHN